jgi:flagellar motility protein MotE (MotC chaperone)
MDYATLDTLRQHHPAWRLLRSEHAPLIASFLDRAFIAPNVRILAAADLAEALEDELFALRQHLGNDAFPKSASDYLNDWAATEKGWLRKFYRQGSDEAYFDLMPATEKAIAWLATLTERSFVGTESRLLTLFELLKQMSEGSQADPARRLAELQARRDEIDHEIARVQEGDVAVLDASALRDRFQQFQQIARELLGDFREVEHNFRRLDRRVRERIALWEGSKGELLGEIMGERDAIADSDQGRSFRAFWDFLMSSQRQEELSARLEEVLALPAVQELKPDQRTRRVHYDWLEAGEHTQRTVAQLSQQLRRFLDDKAWLENRRIMDILHGIESKTIAQRGQAPVGEFMQIADTVASIELPLERPLFSPQHKAKITDLALDLETPEIDASALYTQVVINKAELARHVRQALQERTQVTLKEISERHPLTHGLAELVAYLQLGSEQFKAVIDEDTPEIIRWNVPSDDPANNSAAHNTRQARLPRVIFVR